LAILKKWPPIHTSKAVLRPKLGDRVGERYHATLIGIIYAATDRGECLGPLQFTVTLELFNGANLSEINHKSSTSGDF
jgi:hypothetical protein